MKILMLTYDLPYPLDSGGKIRAYNLIKQLAGNHQITLFSFIRREEQKKDIDKLRPFCSGIRTFKRMKVFSPKHFLVALNPLLTSHIAHYYSSEFKQVLKEELGKKDYDILHFESFYTSLYLGNFKIPQILGTENIEWRVYMDQAKHQKIPFLREAMIMESLRTRWFEHRTWKKADVCLAVSDENAKEIEQIRKEKCYVVQNGVDLAFFSNVQRKKPEKPTILFVGNFKWRQNIDAVRFLVSEIWPIIKNKIKDVRLWIVGRYPPREIKKLSSEEVVIDEGVEDIGRAYGGADVLLAPLRFGSGTKFKVLEAMAAGCPVVTTRLGREGIEAKDGKEVLVREKSEELAQATIEVLTNNALAKKLAQGGRKLIEEKYDWRKIGKFLEKVYEEAISGRKD